MCLSSRRRRTGFYLKKSCSLSYERQAIGTIGFWCNERTICEQSKHLFRVSLLFLLSSFLRPIERVGRRPPQPRSIQCALIFQSKVTITLTFQIRSLCRCVRFLVPARLIEGQASFSLLFSISFLLVRSANDPI